MYNPKLCKAEVKAKQELPSRLTRLFSTQVINRHLPVVLAAVSLGHCAVSKRWESFDVSEDLDPLPQ
jgi:hypothetical protein